ncbi:hypothetical protein OROGR_011506 [Orobanche gracilis]
MDSAGSAFGASTVFPIKLSSVRANAGGSIHLEASMRSMELSITRPDDWHLHLRDGELLEAVIPHSHGESGAVFSVKFYPAGATANSQDWVTDLFGKCLPVFEEMVEQNMPLLLEMWADSTSFVRAECIEIVVAKFTLVVHGEVTSPNVDVFDREKVFIDTVLSPLIQKLPHLKVVMEHITTMDAVNFIESSNEGFVAATVTPQHLVLNRNSIFQGGLQPHNYCLPVLKREIHRRAIVSAVTSGNKRFFLGTDSAPHERRRKESVCGCAGIYNSPVALSVYAKIFDEAGVPFRLRLRTSVPILPRFWPEPLRHWGDIVVVVQVGALDKLEAFTSFNGPDFYGLPRNTSKIKSRKMPWRVPSSFSFIWGDIVSMFAGETLEWLPIGAEMTRLFMYNWCITH